MEDPGFFPLHNAKIAIENALMSDACDLHAGFKMVAPPSVADARVWNLRRSGSGSA